jgi:hypothetical protein
MGGTQPLQSSASPGIESGEEDRRAGSVIREPFSIYIARCLQWKVGVGGERRMTEDKREREMVMEREHCGHGSQSFFVQMSLLFLSLFVFTVLFCFSKHNNIKCISIGTYRVQSMSVSLFEVKCC